MSEWTLDDIAEKLRDIDFAILLTHTESGDIAGRPMSNNRDVEYDGDRARSSCRLRSISSAIWL